MGYDDHVHIFIHTYIILYNLYKRYLYLFIDVKTDQIGPNIHNFIQFYNIIVLDKQIIM